MLARGLESGWRRPRLWLAAAVVLGLAGSALDQSSSPAFFLGLAAMAAATWAMIGLADEAVR